MAYIILKNKVIVDGEQSYDQMEKYVDESTIDETHT